ncbi:hypothetical protein EDI_080230 [Entamoeba dispar SAW760]|uniref:Uncharacterized protein n=1 Tax=Entamoeba dispar (strain ATCC PRA-260 / SAW760) TaxID=370354 RepID=B0ELR2_ENTDS|nr:uncharacterized protein EDI_080230 [Entamoeba dispar SAW760]EDR24536.1 hypothetical protein EDI_080230 [Entamoeba dispar SAW760]|eukprot:EDR24536.1 hypothetical protein EDI_080230 [Entamoeba dispar SAW760]
MATIDFNIHYITYFGQELYICFNDSEYLPMSWTSGHIWVGKKTINGPIHLEWYYLVKVHNKIQRIEEVHGLREYNFNGNNVSVRDWWYYPDLTYVTDVLHEQSTMNRQDINKQLLDEKIFKAKKEAEEKAKKEAEEKAKKEAEEKAKKEAEERARKEAEERARKEAEERARKEAEEKARKEAEEKARKEAEEKAKKEKSEKEKQERLKQLPSLDESVGFYPVQRSKGSPSSSERSSERSESNRLKRSSQIQEQIRKYEELAKSSQEEVQKNLRHSSSSQRVSKNFGK